MVNDLLANHLRIGMTRAQVISLLGEPDEKDATWIRYYLGGRSGGFVLPGYDYLILNFDQQSDLCQICIEESD